MKDCTGCEFYDKCNMSIVDAQARIDALNGLLSGAMALIDKSILDGKESVTDLVDEAGGLGQALYLSDNTDVDIERIDNYFPGTKAKADKVRSSVANIITLSTSSINIIQSTCDGPIAQERDDTVTTNTTRCTSADAPMIELLLHLF